MSEHVYERFSWGRMWWCKPTDEAHGPSLTRSQQKTGWNTVWPSITTDCTRRTGTKELSLTMKLSTCHFLTRHTHTLYLTFGKSYGCLPRRCIILTMIPSLMLVFMQCIAIVSMTGLENEPTITPYHGHSAR